MKWKKLGQIFEFYKSGFAHQFISHSQSPQALVFQDFVRIYFSTREKTHEGKFLSYVQYVDFNKSFTKILNQSQHEVISLGQLGCFDEHGIFPFNPLIAGSKIYAYLSGWTRRLSVDVDSGIGIAISNDNGKSFNRIGDGPVLTSSLYEPFLVIDGFVKLYNNTFHMWYIYGTQWKIYNNSGVPERTYVIGHAESKDGINWTKEGRQIIPSKFEGEAQALPSVIKINNKYHMFFCYRNSYGFRENSENAYRIGYAYSNDLKNWIRDDDNAGITVSEDGWDSEMQCYPHVLKVDENIYMLYNGNEFGKYGFGIAKLENY